jgi:hypothetical protein
MRVPLKNATYVGSSTRMRYVPTYLFSLDEIYDGIKGNNPRSKLVLSRSAEVVFQWLLTDKGLSPGDYNI